MTSQNQLEMNQDHPSPSLMSGRPLSNYDLLMRASELLAKGERKSNLVQFEPYNIREVKRMIDKKSPREAAGAVNQTHNNIVTNKYEEAVHVSVAQADMSHMDNTFPRLPRGNICDDTKNDTLLSLQSFDKALPRFGNALHHIVEGPGGGDSIAEGIDMGTNVLLTYFLHALEIERLVSINKELVEEALEMERELEEADNNKDELVKKNVELTDSHKELDMRTNELLKNLDYLKSQQANQFRQQQQRRLSFDQAEIERVVAGRVAEELQRKGQDLTKREEALKVAEESLRAKENSMRDNLTKTIRAEFESKLEKVREELAEEKKRFGKIESEQVKKSQTIHLEHNTPNKANKWDIETNSSSGSAVLRSTRNDPKLNEANWQLYPEQSAVEPERVFNVYQSKNMENQVSSSLESLIKLDETRGFLHEPITIYDMKTYHTEPSKPLDSRNWESEKIVINSRYTMPTPPVNFAPNFYEENYRTSAPLQSQMRFTEPASNYSQAKESQQKSLQEEVKPIDVPQFNYNLPNNNYYSYQPFQAPQPVWVPPPAQHAHLIEPLKQVSSQLQEFQKNYITSSLNNSRPNDPIPRTDVKKEWVQDAARQAPTSWSGLSNQQAPVYNQDQRSNQIGNSPSNGSQLQASTVSSRLVEPLVIIQMPSLDTYKRTPANLPAHPENLSKPHTSLLDSSQQQKPQQQQQGQQNQSFNKNAPGTEVTTVSSFHAVPALSSPPFARYRPILSSKPSSRGGSVIGKEDQHRDGSTSGRFNFASPNKERFNAPMETNGVTSLNVSEIGSTRAPYPHSEYGQVLSGSNNRRQDTTSIYKPVTAQSNISVPQSPKSSLAPSLQQRPVKEGQLVANSHRDLKSFVASPAFFR